MAMLSAYIEDRCVIPEVKMAISYFTRLKGLMGVRDVKPGFGLWFSGCTSIHCFFMRVPIDVIYLDSDDRVLAVDTVLPWHIGKKHEGCASIVEVASGYAAQAGIEPGRILRLSAPFTEGD